MKYKNGELYAKKILENVKGLQFDDSYHDDNSKDHMPDFRLINGDYIEVTHTNHNMKSNRDTEFHGDKSLLLSKEKQEKMSEAEIENFHKNAIQKACQNEIEITNVEKRHSTDDYETEPLTVNLMVPKLIKRLITSPNPIYRHTTISISKYNTAYCCIFILNTKN